MITIGRKTIRVFLSFAAKDMQAAEDLWDNLREALATSGTFDWQLWAFTDQLLVGEAFDEQIAEAITTADIGLFALSPAFLNSAYIRRHELQPFLAQPDSKRIAPVMLKKLPGSADLRGLKFRQIFGYPAPYWSGRPPHARADWANTLADELHRLAKHYNLGQ